MFDTLSLEHKKPTHTQRHVHGGKHACLWSFPVGRSGSSRGAVISWEDGEGAGRKREVKNLPPVFLFPHS